MIAKKGIAIAVAVALATVGLSMMPNVMASQSVDCSNHNFLISNDKNNPTPRSPEDKMEIGLASVSAVDGDRELFVKVTGIEDGDVLDVAVYDASNSCNEMSVCDFTIETEETESCDIDGPSVVQDREYYVLLDATGSSDPIVLDTWHEAR